MDFQGVTKTNDVVFIVYKCSQNGVWVLLNSIFYMYFFKDVLCKKKAPPLPLDCYLPVTSAFTKHNMPIHVLLGYYIH